MVNGTNKQSLLELILAVRGLAQALDRVQSKLEVQDKRHEDQFRALSQTVEKLDRQMAVLPMTMSDRMDTLVGRQLDHTLDEFRRSLDSLRMSVWQQVGRPVGKDASGSGMHVVDGVPVPLEDEPSASVTLRHDGKVAMTGLVDAGKLWKWVKLVGAALAASGGLAALVKAVIAAVR